ncbi:N-acetylglucosaminidase [Cellulosilyticum sp. WCF-2]|uniref:N-acetylglucosaminidase n=1 Tax=Cellulosilyticum sp. WCF-2 TaxID=2497860 RepID=UPI000F8D1D52|nr:N-acetylglucosaminidase [Cellulosilyticum sp. WCF-2]QEH67483.1 hypothetical protein EKH84_03210 [Cellulosilyticum sp. WCF-2]
MVIETNMYNQFLEVNSTKKNEFLVEVSEIVNRNMNIEIAWEKPYKTTYSKTSENIEMETTSSINETYSNYGIPLEMALNIQKASNPMVSKNGKWVSASLNDIKSYCIPNRYNINNYKYQFLDLSEPAGISVDIMKKYLEGKGTLSGKENVFIQAAEDYHLNEIYLVAHSLLETGNGTSALAQGVMYKGAKVYNMYGIKAIDSNPLGEGAAFAYKMGWTTPDKAIEGGAKYISEQYVNHDIYAQDTLYEMRWNPASPGTHQYATDVAWAIKQAKRIEEIYEEFEDANKTFDIPVYR